MLMTPTKFQHCENKCLPIVELEWMLTHPTLENVYPLLEANTNSPLMERVRRLLAPRYGDDLFERPLDWMA
jgi:hypothetical protein